MRLSVCLFCLTCLSENHNFSPRGEKFRERIPWPQDQTWSDIIAQKKKGKKFFFFQFTSKLKNDCNDPFYLPELAAVFLGNIARGLWHRLVALKEVEHAGLHSYVFSRLLGVIYFFRARTHKVKEVPRTHKFESKLAPNPLFFYRIWGSRALFLLHMYGPLRLLRSPLNVLHLARRLIATNR